jgi:FkbM family methyltransferase
MRFVRRLLDPVLGRRELQPIFAYLHRVSLIGMNYGGGTDCRHSGEHEALRYVAAALRRTCKPPYVMFDVGANKGKYARMALRVFGSDAAIHSFEPSAATFEMLRQSVGSRAHLHNFGLSERPGILTLYSDTEGSGLASVHNRDLNQFGLLLNRSEEIQISTIDEFCAAAGIQRIHFLKLDVEGHELAVLKGAASLLSQRRIAFIQFEFGGCNLDSRTYFRDFHRLLSRDYRISRIVKNGLVSIERYEENGEIFTTTNYLAELRQNQS